MPETLFQKVWKRHVVTTTDEATLLYIDRHLVHEVTSPQAFEGLRLAGRKVRRPDLTFATLDHNVPTENQLDIREPMSRRQVETLRANCREFGVTLYDIGQRPPGDRPRHRPRAGADPPRPDDRLRRQPHEHPRRLRGPGVRHRHQRGRARPGDADALARAATPVARRRGDRPAGAGAGAQGHHPGHHPGHRHGRGDRARHRVLRAGDRGAVDGRADDDLQHVDRGGRPRRDDRPRRHDLRIHHPGRPPLRSQGGGARRRAGRLEGPAHRRPLGLRPPRHASTPRHWCRRSPGGPTLR